MNIQGYVCVVETKMEKHTFQILFGRPVDKYMQPYGYESLASNGLKPFQTLEEAREASLSLEKRDDIDAVWLGRIEMKILDPDELDNPDIRQATNLVVVEYRDKDDISLRGTLVEPFCSTVPGTPLEQNGFRPFDSFDSAYYVAHEARRQAACPVALATFKLERVTPP